VYIFLPGGMGINFIKQFVAPACRRTSSLITPGFSSDQDIIARCDPCSAPSMRRTGPLDLDNGREQEYRRGVRGGVQAPADGVRLAGYDTALLIDSAVRAVKGKIEDTEAVRKAPRREVPVGARIRSVQPQPVPDPEYYLRVVGRDAQGRIVNKISERSSGPRRTAYVRMPMK